MGLWSQFFFVRENFAKMFIILRGEKTVDVFSSRVESYRFFFIIVASTFWITIWFFQFYDLHSLHNEYFPFEWIAIVRLLAQRFNIDVLSKPTAFMGFILIDSIFRKIHIFILDFLFAIGEWFDCVLPYLFDKNWVCVRCFTRVCCAI